MRLPGLKKLLLIPLIQGIVAIIVVALLGGIYYYDLIRESSLEQDIILFVSKGEVIDQNNLIIATEVENAVQGKIDVERFAAVLGNDPQAYIAKTAIKTMPLAQKIADDPTLYESLCPKETTWKDYSEFIIPFCSLFFFGFINIGFFLASFNRDKDANPDNRNPATYPWHKPWGWMIAPLLLPYLIISQPIWLIGWALMRLCAKTDINE